MERFHLSYDRECLHIHRPTTLEQVRDVTQQYQHHYNSERPHQGRACANRPPLTAFPRLPKRPSLPATIDLDGWLDAVAHRVYRRRVNPNGVVQLGRQTYYVQKALARQEVALQVQVPTHELQVLLGKQIIKTLPLKGLHRAEVDFETFLRVMCQEAVSEYRLYRRNLYQRLLI